MKRALVLAVVLAVVWFVSFQSSAWTLSPSPDIRLGPIDSGQLLHDLKILSADDMEGRQPATPGSVKARDYILKRFAQSGIRQFGNSYLHGFTLESGSKRGSPGVNVIGYIKGERRPERYIVVTAHYDHIGIKDGKVFNGANDNASGVAALFALAKYFSTHRPRNTLIFAALDGEEDGLLGAKAFLANPVVTKRDMVMNVNVDMICRDEKNKLYAVGTHHYPFLRPYLTEVAATAPVKLLMGHDGSGIFEEDWTKDSDHYVFHKEKIPFIYFGTEDYKYHHNADDDYSNITPLFYIGAVETILEAIKRFDANLEAIEKQVGLR